MEQREMNFFDLCVACGRAIGRGCVALWQLFARMLRLSVRYWWVVLITIALSIAALLYYSRYDNLNYRVNAVAMLNGTTIQQFEQAYSQLNVLPRITEDNPMHDVVWGGLACDFRTYRVVDCYADGTADYIDFKGKSSPTDTVKVQMHDRLALQFRIRQRNMAQLPLIEEQLLAYLNADPAMQKAYETYLPNLQYEVEFNHAQAAKLDSATSAYYFYGDPGSAGLKGVKENGVVFTGDRKVRPFLDKIYEQHRHTEQLDYRLALATAPVTLENHFAVDPNPSNNIRKCAIPFLFLGWILGCLIAGLIDRRKAICAWLRQ